jgi:hypothetical protein
VKELEFQTYVHYYDDEDGDEHSSTVEAAQVEKGHLTRMSEDENGVLSRVARKFYVQTLGDRVSLQLGDWVLKGYRPDVYDVLSAEQWAANGYELPEDAEAKTQDKPAAKKVAASPPK